MEFDDLDAWILLMAKDTARLLSALVRIYPANRLLTGAAELTPYQSDGLTAFHVRPGAVVIPETQEEVVETVKLCHSLAAPFLARGSGTSLSGGSVPIAGGVLIAINRLNRVLRYDCRQRLAVVEPGVINLRVSQVAAADGLYYSPDPSSQSVCTIGGNVAFNSGGAHCLKYGMTANHVLGLKVVLPDGEVVQLGGDSLEATGPDLVGMFVGSEGLFGIALEITLRLLPKPDLFCTVLAAYDCLAKAGDAVARVVRSGLLPGAIEIMDRLAMDAAEAAIGASYTAGAQAVLIVELEGIAEQVEAEYPRLRKVIEESGATTVQVARDEAERAWDLEGPQGRVLGRWPPQPGLHRAGRRGSADQARRGSGGSRAIGQPAQAPCGQRVPCR